MAMHQQPNRRRNRAALTQHNLSLTKFVKGKSDKKFTAFTRLHSHKDAPNATLKISTAKINRNQTEYLAANNREPCTQRNYHYHGNSTKYTYTLTSRNSGNVKINNFRNHFSPKYSDPACHTVPSE
ncbi:MAG: hypothetical protein CM15mP38_2860 [Synechococcus sp.]|nr:MAG: hypothetical protein CM15mP38_2860 [Synechococcus sp.]